jgi:hypothetical protein
VWAVDVAQIDSGTPIMEVDGIDHEWLRHNLGWPLDGREEIVVRSISHSAGSMGTVHRVCCAGRSIIFKGPPEKLDAWGTLVTDTGLMAREVHSYRFLQASGSSAPRVSPTCHWSALSSGGRAALALEDIGSPQALNVTMASGLSRAQTLSAVQSLAVLHALSANVGADPLSAPHPWLYTAVSAGLNAWVQMGLDELPRVMAARWPGEVTRAALQRVQALDMQRVFARSHLEATCIALCHGDVWAGNVLFVASGQSADGLSAFLVDWQFAMWGNPMSDVALLLLSSVNPSSRQAWEDEVIAHYHAVLISHCALEYTLDACREDFHRATPFAAAVALATLEDYTVGMDSEELSQFQERVLAALWHVAQAADGDATT